VTSRNIVGIRLLRAAGAMTSHVYVVARRRAAILSDCKGSGRRDVTTLLNNAMTVARRPLTQLGYISEVVSRFSSVPGVTVKKSVLGSSSTREFTSQLLSSSLQKES
jgi:hypothetical protein